MSQSSQIDHVTTFISTIGEDLARGDETEQEVGRILDALQVALQTGATTELAAILEPWIDRKLTIAARRTT